MSLVLGMILDALLGEPRWLWGRMPHPAVLMGRLIGWADRRFNHGPRRRAAGVAVMAGLGAGAFALGLVLEALPGRWLDVLVIAILLAQRSLVDHVHAVADGLAEGLPQARHAVAMIVGRDTADMDEPQIARAAIESAAENLSDGVIAPIFWFALAGLPGLLLYKITNTADSMIGYRTPRHQDFGWAAARFDDLLNVAPARLTALLLWLPRRRGSWGQIAADARQHRSPNAGWPEAAIARALNIALSGPRSYEGQMREFPWVHGAGRTAIGGAEIRATCRLLWSVWAMALVAAFGAVIV